MKTNQRSLAFVFHKVHTLKLFSNFTILAVTLSAPVAAMAQTTVLDPLKWSYVQDTPYPSPSSPYSLWQYTYPGNNPGTHADFSSFSPYAPGFFPTGITVPLPTAPEWLLDSGYPFSYGAYGFSVSGASVSVTFTATSTEGLVCYSGPQDGNTGNIQIHSVPVTLTSTVTTGSPGTNIACWNTGKKGIVITVTRFAITYGVDLKVDKPLVSQPNATLDPKDNILQVVPNVPVQIDVPVSGFTGFDASPGATTTVTLQAGPHTLPPQTVFLAEIPATGTKTVSFNVTFKPEDAGLQTIKATIDPENTLGESDLLNNTETVQVKVKPQYKLVVMANGKEVDSTPVSIEPSVYVHNGCGQSNAPQTQNFIVQCFDSSNAPTDQCYLSEAILDLGDEIGGHDHGPLPRPFGKVTPQLTASKPINIPTNGLRITYEASEISQEVLMSLSADDKDGNPIASTDVKIDVQVEGSENFGWGPLYNENVDVIINGADLQPSHTLGYFGTRDMFTAVEQLGKNYLLGLIPLTDIPHIKSQAASLPWGGLYDIGQNWSPSHCGHRDGMTMDISLAGTSRQERTAIQNAAKISGLQFTYIPESPFCTENPNNKQCIKGAPNHWHATLGLGR